MAPSFEHYSTSQDHFQVLFPICLHPEHGCPHPQTGRESDNMCSALIFASPSQVCLHGTTNQQLVSPFPRGCYYTALNHPSHTVPPPTGCHFSGGPRWWTWLSCLHAITTHVIFHLKRSPLAEFQSALKAVMRFPGTLWNPTDSLGSSTWTPHNLFIPIVRVVAYGNGKESTCALILWIAIIGSHLMHTDDSIWIQRGLRKSHISQQNNTCLCCMESNPPKSYGAHCADALLLTKARLPSIP